MEAALRLFDEGIHSIYIARKHDPLMVVCAHIQPWVYSRVKQTHLTWNLDCLRQLQMWSSCKLPQCAWYMSSIYSTKSLTLKIPPAFRGHLRETKITPNTNVLLLGEGSERRGFLLGGKGIRTQVLKMLTQIVLFWRLNIRFIISIGMNRKYAKEPMFCWFPVETSRNDNL